MKTGSRVKGQGFRGEMEKILSSSLYPGPYTLVPGP
jgi:hypothetical protein